MKSKRCNWPPKALRLVPEFDTGCPLDHCMCGTHDVDNVEHQCKVVEYDEDVAAAEHAAGWDSSP